jgi:hypothetical protein
MYINGVLQIELLIKILSGVYWCYSEEETWELLSVSSLTVQCPPFHLNRLSCRPPYLSTHLDLGRAHRAQGRRRRMQRPPLALDMT